MKSIAWDSVIEADGWIHRRMALKDGRQLSCLNVKGGERFYVCLEDELFTTAQDEEEALRDCRSLISDSFKGGSYEAHQMDGSSPS